MRVLYVYNTPRMDMLARFQRGEGPDDFLYGFDHMPKFGIDADFFDHGHNKIASRLSLPVKIAISKLLSIGFDIDQALLLLPKMKNYDILLTTVDHNGFPITFLKYLSVIKTPQVYVSMTLADTLRTTRSRLIINLYKRIMEKTSAIITLSELEAASIAELLRVPEDKIRTVPFGVDAEFFKPMEREIGDYIMTIGKNVARDYRTLFQAVKDVDVKLMASVSRFNMKGLEIPSNVDVYYSHVPYLRYKEAIASAKFTAIPLPETESPTGHSSILEIMAMGKAVILTRIRSLFKTGLRDFENCVFVKPGDAEDMREKIRYLLDNPDVAEKIGKNARRLVEEKHSSENYAKGIAEVLWKVYEGR